MREEIETLLQQSFSEPNCSLVVDMNVHGQDNSVAALRRAYRKYLAANQFSAREIRDRESWHFNRIPSGMREAPTGLFLSVSNCSLFTVATISNKGIGFDHLSIARRVRKNKLIGEEYPFPPNITFSIKEACFKCLHSYSYNLSSKTLPPRFLHEIELIAPDHTFHYRGIRGTFSYITKYGFIFSLASIHE